MEDQRDPYEVLGLWVGCTAEQVKAAYRKLSKQYHPDCNPSPDAQERFCEVNAAYERLSFIKPVVPTCPVCHGAKQVQHRVVTDLGAVYVKEPCMECCPESF